MELKIYKQNGELRTTVSPSDSSTHQKGIMADNVLNLSFTLYEFVRLYVNDYITYQGETFALLNDYRPQKKSSIEYQYDVKFYGIESELKKALVLKMVDNDNDTTFALNDSAAVHLQLIVDNVNRIKGSKNWRIGEVVASVNKDVAYDRTNCYDALNKLAETFETEWWIEGNTINLTRCEHGDLLVLGYQQGLKNITKDTNETAPFFTRLYPIGSTRNIDRAKYGYPRLQLPGGAKYVEINTHLGIVEHSEEAAFTEIYPRRVGKVGTVRKEAKKIDGEDVDIYYFTDPGLTFNPNDYEIAGLVKHIKFDSGTLNGWDFEANWDAKKKEFELINQYPYENQQIPGGTMIPKTGDEYVLWNVRMPDEYYTLAEKEYKAAVDKFLEKYSIDTSVYKAPTDYIYFDEHNINLKIGRRVKLISPEYFDDAYRDSRVTSITRKINNPGEADIECSYAVDPGRMSKLENDLVNIEAAVKEQTNKEVLQILKSWDSADPSEYNVFSAKRSLREFLSKNQPDEAKGLINFVRGIGIAAKLVTDILRVGDKGDPSNESIYSSLRTNKEIEKAIEELDKKYLRKDIEDTAKKLIHFLEGTDTKGVATFHDTLNSPDFVSGFLDGKGWAVMLREFMNAAGVNELKSYAEFDEVTVRGGLRVFELIINQLKGESDNYIFSGMMKVDHVDLKEKKIYLDTGGGLLYNPFRVNDCLMCQRYGGKPAAGKDYNIIKTYELVVSGAGHGSDADGDKRLDWISYNNFTGKEADISKGDIVVRVDNLTDPNRKGIIMNTTIGEFAPYMDIVYGLKTDPENAVKSRHGNLTGIYNHWFGWLKGFGDFIQNLYAIGEFHFRNGENIQTRLDMMENLFRVDMQNSSYNMGEEDNFLTNATFTENMEKWERENVIRPFTVNGKLLMFNRNLFASKEKVAGVVNYEGKNMLRIKDSGIRQLNRDIRKPDPATSKLYLSFKFICKTSGKLTCGFEGSSAGEGKLPFIKDEAIPAGYEFETRNYSGTWDGKGDFVLRFTGDIYIDLLAITNKPLDDFKIEVGTKFEQTAERITLQGYRIDGIDNTISNLGIELDAAKENIRLWGEKVDKNRETITQLGIDLDLAEGKLDLYANKTDEINNTVTNLGIRMNAAEGQLDIFASFKDSASGTLTNLGTRMKAAEGTIETYATRLNSHDGSITSLGQRMSAAEGTLSTYVTKTNAIDGTVTSLGTRMSAAEKKFTNYVLLETFNGYKGDTQATLNRHWTAIEQTEKDILLSINKSVGYPLYRDMRFETGMNGINVYNNSGGSAVTVKRIIIHYGKDTPTAYNYPAVTWTTNAVKDQHVGDVYRNIDTGAYYIYQSNYIWASGNLEFGTVPTDQPGIIRITKTVGNSSPGLGGFHFGNASRANAVFEARFTAKIPAGFSLNFASNSTGTGTRTFWITDNKGTGNWAEYKFQVFCGQSGSFSSTNFFYLTKDGSTDTYNTAVTWYLQDATVFDLTGYQDPVSYINLTENMVKIKASRIQFEGLVTANNNFKILEDGSIETINGKFSGELNGVTGTFRTLNCKNSAGQVVGGITFDPAGSMWFSGDILHQGGKNGRSLRFYTSDLWCRGSFGAYQSNTLVIYGSYGYYYTNGLTQSQRVYVSLNSYQTTSNKTYYMIPLYGQADDASGFPVDLVVIKISSGTYRFAMSNIPGKRVLVVNAHDQHNDIYIYSNGREVQFAGGVMGECVNLTGFLNPEPGDTIVGRGWLVSGMRDNNWA